MKHDIRPSAEHSSADDAIRSGRICTVPNTNDWYLTTDQGVTLGPYRSREEAVSMLQLLGLRDMPRKANTDWGKT